MSSPYSILGIQTTASKDEIKRAYKEIALACHPDKLGHLTDESERKSRIEKFKNATIAYNKLMNSDNSTFYDDYEYEANEDDINIWKNMDIKDIFFDVAKMFFKAKIYPKTYYQPQAARAAKASETGPDSDTASTCSSSSSSSNSTSTTEDKAVLHNVKLEVTYAEILCNAKKKLRLFLADVPDPVFVDIYCGSFPEVTVKQNGLDIVITMLLKPVSNYDHIISANGTVDLITTIEITLQEYIMGYTKDIPYVDGSTISVTIPPFHTPNVYEIKDKGLCKGSLLLNINVQNISKNQWNTLSEKDKHEMLRILDALHKMI